MPYGGLSEHSWMLVLERLRPGDVILTTAQDNDSQKIQRLAGGYSHAALFAGFGVLEATYDEHFSGVRFTLPSADDIYMGLVDGAPATLWAIPDVSSCDVYRFKPQTPDEDREYSRLTDGIQHWDPDLLYQPYASPRTLAQAWLERAWLRRRWVRSILNNRALRALLASYLSRRMPRHLREGYFCSQLVALVYAKAGLAIFKSLRPMPGDLARALSKATPDPVIDREAAKNVAPSILRGTVARFEPRLLDLARSAQDAQDMSIVGFSVLEGILVRSVGQIESVAHHSLQQRDLDEETRKEIMSSLDILRSKANDAREVLRRHQHAAAPARNAR